MPHPFEFPATLFSLADVVRWRAEAHPSRHAFTFLADGERVAGVLTYAELDARARAIAGFLQDRGAQGCPVLLCYPSGLEFVSAFLGCLYAGALAVPAYPPRNRRHVSRVQAIVRDSRAPIVLASGSHAREIGEWLPTGGDAGHAVVVDSQLIGSEAAAWWTPLVSAPGDVAYLQYTSGSTSTPKGVIESHECLLRNCEAIEKAFALHRDSLTVSWLPLFHDMGLVLTLVAPLMTGTPVVMMTPAAMVQRPLRWLDAVSRFRATHSGGPNFAFELIVERTTPEQRAALDLSAWEVSYNGSEPLRRATLDRFNDAFAVSRFSPLTHVPAYGLAEATLLVSSKPVTEKVRTLSLRAAALSAHRAEAAGAGESGALDVVCCGVPVIDTEMLIVDPATLLRVPDDGVGEIWVRGPGLALGYWKNEAATDAIFRAHTADGHGPFLRTGDLGFLRDGHVYITGRIKDVVILRGRNHYPHDIEITVQEAHPSLERDSGAAFGVTEDGDERLIVVQEVSRTALRSLNGEQALDAVRQAVVSEHEIEIGDLLLVAPLEVPKTSSGKIQRSEARERYLAGEFKVLARWIAPASPARHADVRLPAAAEPVHDAARQQAIEQWLVTRLSELRGAAPRDIDVSRPFSSFGIDSIAAVRLSGELEEWLGQPLSPTLLYDHPDIRGLSIALASGRTSSTAPAGGDVHEPVAIIGMGCRFPGADGPEAFWSLLASGGDAVTEPPPERWNQARVPVGPAGTPGHAASLRGGYLRRIDEFDAEFFGISPREAVDLDPQQRLLLEVAWSALEDAGIPAGALAGSQTGVFVGLSTREYGELLASGDPRALGPYYGTGTAASAAAGRLSYVLGLEGPSLVVDTACSSSLVAIHLAAQSLRQGECRTALAGGVNVVLSPELNVALSQARMLSPHGRCRTFDAGADGYVRGEGCGVIVLKRLRDAVADGDRVLAVVRGSAINQDGRTNGLSAPSARAQERVVGAALRAAGIAPAEIGYVEAHGTGTPLGDPIEVQALARVFGARDVARPPACLGSVKTNIGHLEAAAGIAGVIKVVLSLAHGLVPPHLHLETPNAMIAWDSVPFTVPRTVEAWPAGRTRRTAGVSSFGFVGTNAHVVLEAAPEVARPGVVEHDAQGEAPALFAISARTPAALDVLASGYAAVLGGDGAPSLRELCAAAATTRTHFRQRLAIVAESAAQLRAALEQQHAPKRGLRVHRGERAPGGEPRVVFLFTGQGSQYAGMARRLYEGEPVFRAALDRCAALFEPHLDVSLLQVLHPADPADARIDQTGFSQPALFAVEWALAELWRARGVVPAAVIGHSIGEFVAACVAGVFTLDEAVPLVAARARAMQSLPSGGAMAAVSAAEATVLDAIAQERGLCALAAVNAPSQCVISGESEAVTRVMRRLEDQGIACERLNVSHAFHSPLMEPAIESFDGALAGIRFAAPRVPMFANLYGREASPGEIDGPDYWRRQIPGTIRFGECMAAAADRGFTTFLEIGPQPTLTSLAQQTLGATGTTWAASLRRRVDDGVQMADAAGALYAAGVDFPWPLMFPGPRAFVALPRYPFQRERYWTAHGTAGPRLGMPAAPEAPHPLLGMSLPLADASERAWIKQVDVASAPWLADHRVDSAVVHPGTGFIEAASVAARELLGLHDVELTGITFEQPLVLDAGESRQLQVHARREAGAARVSIHSRAAGGPGEWTRHCVMQAASYAPSGVPGTWADAAARCAVEIPPAAFYERWRERGNQWSGVFQGIATLQVGTGEAVARIDVPAGVAEAGGIHPAHPALLDACVQVLAAVVGDERQGAFVGKAVGAVRLPPRMGAGPFHVHATLRDVAAAGRTVSGDVRVTDAEGRIAAEFVDVRFEFINFSVPAPRGADRWLHATEWIDAPPPVADLADARAWVIVHTAEAAASARACAEALQARGCQVTCRSAGSAREDAASMAARIAAVAAMAREGLHASNPARLLLLTGAGVSDAAVRGFARTLAAECPSLGVTVLETEPDATGPALARAAHLLCAETQEREIVVRGERLLVPRLTELRATTVEAPSLRADASYVVTGGLGALGRHVAKWLVSRGARHLVLLSRTVLPPRARWNDLDDATAEAGRVATVLDLERMGANVTLAAVDVADESAVSAWYQAHRDECRPPVCAVVHAAGVVQQGPAAEVDEALAHAHLAAKVQGALALDRVLSGVDLDAFVLFSSASASIPSPGLAAYGAANAGLDAVAAARRARGARAVSVQWGAWAGGGMAEAAYTGDNARAAEVIPPETGVRLLGLLWPTDRPVVAVLPIDWERWAGFGSVAGTPFLSRVTRPARSAAPDSAGDDPLAGDPEGRRERLTQWLARQAAEVLRLGPGGLDSRASLRSYGLDSLMALEIRNRVQGRVHVTLPLVELVRGGSIEQLVSAIEQRLHEGSAPAPARAVVSQSDIAARPWPLSHGQQAQWLLHSMQPESASYHVAFTARIGSSVDAGALSRAWQQLRARHAMLRARWTRRDGELVQEIHPEVPESFEALTASGSEDDLRRTVEAAYRRPFHLEHGPPARLHLISRGRADHVLLLVAHHIACDGWSLWVLVDELRVLYEAAAAGQTAALPELPASYIDYVQAERALIDGPEGQRQWAFWQERLSGEILALDLPTDRPRAATPSSTGESLEIRFPPALREAVERLARQRGTTVFTVLAAGLAGVLHRYTGQDDLLVGMPAAGRTDPAFAAVVGHFVNQVVLRTEVSGELTFAQLLERTQSCVLDAMGAQDLPFPVLVQRLRPGRDASRSPLFQVNFVFQQAQQAGEILDLMTGSPDSAPIEWAGLQLRPYVLHQQEGQFDLTVEIADTGRELRGLLKFSPELWDRETMARMGAHYAALVAAAARQPDTRVLDLPMLSADERANALERWRGGTKSWPAETCLHERFARAARRAPSAVALVDGTREITYGELDARANQVAAVLRAGGIGTDDLVALFFEPGAAMIEAILGVLKAGAAYLPLDATYPDDRLAFMLDDSRAKVLLTEHGHGARFTNFAGTVLDLERDAARFDAAPAGDVGDVAGPHNLAYCIYTSGTTGRPKGVLVEHRQVARLFDATDAWFSFGPQDVWTLFHSYAFDFSVWEIWGALLYGGRLVIVPRTVSRAPEAFRALVHAQGVTVLNQTPSAFREFIAADQRTTAPRGALRVVIFGGEALDTRVLQPWIARHGHTPELVNMYGITETTVHVTYARVTDVAREGPSHIGVPIPDLELYVLDAAMQPVPVGVRGELYVGGSGLARGYLNRPELTAQRFVPHPFSAEPGRRLYRTGDVARYRPDGSFEYLGRIDRQVKIRGFRIERGEIESALRACPGVADALVTARAGAGGDPALFAYVVRADDHTPAPDDLKRRLRAALPEYMVPSSIHVLDAYPLTPNGKVDDGALAALGVAQAHEGPRAAPATVTERAVAEVWRDVLGVDEVGLHDNFFDLGGHSLLVPRVHRALADRFDSPLTILDLFRYPTVGALAAHLQGSTPGGGLDAAEKRAQLRQARRGARPRGRVPS